MKVNIIQHCDEAMQDGNVVAFVTAVFRAVEGKTRAFHTMARPSHGEPWVELYVGRTIVSCRADLVDTIGILGEWNHTRGRFYPPQGVVRGTPCPYRLL